MNPTEWVFLLPDLGEGLTEAEIVEWRVAVGDPVQVDQTVVEVETAKAVVDVPCPYAGRVVALHGAPGDRRPVGQPLITVAPLDTAGPGTGGSSDAGPGTRGPGTGGTGSGPAGAAEAAREVYREEERAGSGNVLIGYGTGPARSGGRRRRVGAVPLSRPRAPAQGTESGTGAVDSAAVTPDLGPVAGNSAAGASESPPPGRVPAAPMVISPLVRRLAREHGVDVTAVAGTGLGGTVRRADVRAFLDATARRRVPDQDATPVPRARQLEPAVERLAVPDPAPAGDVVIPLRGVRRAIADKLSRSRREIPEVTIWVDVDATGLLETRAAINAATADRPVGMLALLARICVAALRRFPDLNARVDSARQEIVRSGRIHLGIAAQTDRGLMVPVVSDAQNLTTLELAAALAEATGQARSGTLPPARLTGGTFTLNNYGVFGVDGSTPIINHPEAALLGIGRIVAKPWVVDGQLAVRQVAQLSLTFDHRVCDGGVAGGFLRFVADCVERPALLVANL